MSPPRRRTACCRSRSRAGVSFAPPAQPRCRLQRRRSSIADYREVAAVAERKPVNAASYEVGKWLGTAPREWAGNAATEYLADIRESDPIYTRENLGHPGLLQRVMNRVLVDNAILGPWIHVGSKMQLLSAGQARRRNHRARQSDRQLRQEGPPLRRARRAGGRQRQDAAGALLAHRDLPAARTGGGVGRSIMPSPSTTICR